MRHKTDFEEWTEFTKGDWQCFIKQGIKNVQGVLYTGEETCQTKIWAYQS